MDDYLKSYANRPGMDLLSMVRMAGFELKEVRQIPNERLLSMSQERPWFIIKTQFDCVLVLGWRKSVINIEWQFSPFRGVITTDDVTKDEKMVHAWSYAKGIEYLTQLRREFENLNKKVLTDSANPL